MRNKLIILYSVFIIATFAGFAYWTYCNIEKWFFNRIDETLYSSAISIDEYIEKFYFYNNTKNDNNIHFNMLKNIYESISLNPRRHYIQILDTNNNLIWKSSNLGDFELPNLPNKKQLDELRTFAQEKYEYDTVPKVIFRKNLKGDIGDTVYTLIPFKDKNLRLFLIRTKNAYISIGYSLDWLNAFLRKLAYTFYFSIPLIVFVLILILILISIIGHSQTKKLSSILNKIAESELKNFNLNGLENKEEYKDIVTSIQNLYEACRRKHERIINFAYDASHELKTPLTILRGELELSLNTAKTVEDYQEVVASALDEVIRLSNVVSTVLELAKTDNASFSINFTDVNLSELVKDICIDMEIIANDKNQKLIQEIQSDIQIKGDSNKIHQIVLNLLDNAIKYTPDGGEIKIQLYEKFGNAVLIVEDNGIGIPEDQFDAIFTKFYRTQEAKKFGVQGTGLGLSLVKSYVQLHNGNIQVESKVGYSSKFTVTLPLVNNK